MRPLWKKMWLPTRNDSRNLEDSPNEERFDYLINLPEAEVQRKKLDIINRPRIPTCAPLHKNTTGLFDGEPKLKEEREKMG